MRRMSDRLLDADSVAQELTTGTLNTSLTSDLSLMGELQMIQDVLKTVSSLYSLISEQALVCLFFDQKIVEPSCGSMTWLVINSFIFDINVQNTWHDQKQNTHVYI